MLAVTAELESIAQPSALASPCVCGQFDDPLGVGIPSDSLMEWIDEDNLREFEHGISTKPVRIQDSQTPTVVPSLLLSNRLKASGKPQQVNIMMDRLAMVRTLRNRVFAATMVHTNPINDITLLGLVPQPAHPEKQAHHIRLLLPPSS